MQKLPDPSLIAGLGRTTLAVFDKVNELVDAVNRLRSTGPTPAGLKIQALERHARALTVRVEELERQVRRQKGYTY